MSVQKSLSSWMRWCRDERVMTLMLTESYLPGKTDEYRKGREEALADAESRLGLLMLELGIDLRVVP